MSAFVYFQDRLTPTSNIRLISNLTVAHSLRRIANTCLSTIRRSPCWMCVSLLIEKTLLCLKAILCPPCRKTQGCSVCAGHERYVRRNVPMGLTIPMIPISTVTMLTSTFQDSWWHKLQHLDSTAGLRYQTLKFDIQSQRPSTPTKLSSCALNLFVPNVSCARPPSTAIFPTLFLGK